MDAQLQENEALVKMTCAELADVVEGLRGQSRTPLGVRGSPSLQHPFGPNQIKRVTLPGWGPLAEIFVCVCVCVYVSSTRLAHNLIFLAAVGFLCALQPAVF